ncbi:hypothetical protein MUK42_32530 [Musa troglodytarum]|uniref:Uncharacterized protein n=1 Tax=Musa troglodytarum TaxID=320322 RepID=A0A9E7FCU6_9LILI|nr:hypothetical protein MUK42_32530 [Musa troglodytarum]
MALSRLLFTPRGPATHLILCHLWLKIDRKTDHQRTRSLLFFPPLEVDNNDICHLDESRKINKEMILDASLYKMVHMWLGKRWANPHH